MEYEQILNAIYEAANDFADETGSFPTVLHVHPSTYRDLAAGSANKHDGLMHWSGDFVNANMDMFMDFHLEVDRTVPKDGIVLNDSLMHGIEVKYDALQDIFVVWTVRPDGTHVGKPYLSPTQDKAIAKAHDIACCLGKDYLEYKGTPTY